MPRFLVLVERAATDGELRELASELASAFPEQQIGVEHAAASGDPLTVAYLPEANDVVALGDTEPQRTRMAIDEVALRTLRRIRSRG